MARESNFKPSALQSAGAEHDSQPIRRFSKNSNSKRFELNFNPSVWWNPFPTT